MGAGRVSEDFHGFLANGLVDLACFGAAKNVEMGFQPVLRAAPMQMTG